MSAAVRVASLGQVPCGGALRVEIDGRAVALVRTEQGELYALDDRCSHEEASLAEGFVEERAIECPRHGALFDLRDGRAMTLPATAPVQTHDVEVRGDDVLVRLRGPIHHERTERERKQ